MNLNDYSLWTALITPLKPSLALDENSLANLIKEQEQAQNGLLILGSTGEALNLSLEMKKQIVEFTLAQKPKVPVMVGVGGHDLPAQMKWIQWLETKNIDAYLMVTPIYAKPGTFGQYEWFNTLMNQVSKPVMLYNVPGRAAKELSYKTVEMLKEHPQFWAIKEASGSPQKMKTYLDASGGKKLYCGDDPLMQEFAQVGACGLVSVASNTWPKETHLYVQKCLQNKLEEKETWVNAAKALFVASNPVPAKALLCLEERIAHDTMMPPLSRRDLTDIQLLKNSSNNIQTWYNKYK